jgi:hypothetical protein
MKVIYPGPAVLGAARVEPTLHPRLGRLEVGENEQPDDDVDVAAALAGGLLELPGDAKKRQVKAKEDELRAKETAAAAAEVDRKAQAKEKHAAKDKE